MLFRSMPCSRFGSNAAWFRLAVISFNVLTALKRLALPAELLAARPLESNLTAAATDCTAAATLHRQKHLLEPLLAHSPHP